MQDIDQMHPESNSEFKKMKSKKPVNSLSPNNYKNGTQTDVAKTNPIDDAIQTSSILDQSHSSGRDSYIVDFGYRQQFQFSKYKTIYDGFWGYFALNSTAQFSVDFTLPVNITMTYNDTVEAGRSNQVDTQLYRVPGGATFTSSYGFTLGGIYGSFDNRNTFQIFNYTNTYPITQFDVPLDRTPLPTLPVELPLWLVDASTGVPVSNFLGVNLLITPELDADISTNLFYNDSDGFINKNSLTFDTAEQKSFSIKTDEFAKQRDNVDFGLTDFAMNFKLSITWGLQLTLKSILSIIENLLGPLKINILTYPTVPIGGLPTDGVASGYHDVIGSSEEPKFAVKSYNFDDQTSTNNGILEPGDTATVSVDIQNYGPGAATSAGIYAASSNVSITQSTSNFTDIPSETGTVSHSIDISLASGYTQRNVTIYYAIDWESTNGTKHTNYERLRLRVLQSNDAYLNIDEYAANEPNDGLWDPSEVASIEMNLTKVGDAEIDYSEVILYDLSISGFTTNNSVVSKYGPYSTWNISDLYLKTPSYFVENRVQVLTYVKYNLSDGTTYLDSWIMTFELEPPEPEMDLINIYASLTNGTDNGIFEAGESFEVNADLKNIGDDDSGYVVGVLSTNATDISIENEYLIWDNHLPGENQTSSNTLTMKLSPRAKNQTTILELTVFYFTAAGDLKFNVFQVIFNLVEKPAPKLSLNYYNVYNYDPNSLQTQQTDTPTPGLYSYITVNLDVLEGPAYSANAILSNNNTGVPIVNETSYYGNLDVGESKDGDGFWIYVPPNFEGGVVEFYVNVTVQSATGDTYYRLGYFQIDIAQGDVEEPGYQATYDTVAKEGEQITFTINTQDNSGVASVYFAYYNNSNQEWNVSKLDWINSTAVEKTMSMPDFDLHFAFIVFDTANNYNTAGIDSDIFVSLNTTSDTPDDPDDPPDDPDDPSNDPDDPTDETNTTSTTSSTSQTDGEIQLLAISFYPLLVAILIPLIIRRKFKN